MGTSVVPQTKLKKQKQKGKINMTNELGIFINNDRPVVSSRDIARVFEKEHKHIMEAIRKLDCSADFARSNFLPGSYKDAQNQERPEYLITRDGFSFLAMGFTGAKAAEFKEKYIAAFNAMERELANRPQLPDFTNPAVAARAWADEYEQRLALEAKIEKDKPDTDYGKALSHAETYVLVSQAANQMKQAGCTFVCFDGDRAERKPIGPKYLRKYLENEGYVVKPGRKDSGRPTDKGSKNGRIREKAHIWGPTNNYTSYTPELSPAFVKHLIQRFKDSEIRIEKILH